MPPGDRGAPLWTILAPLAALAVAGIGIALHGSIMGLHRFCSDRVLMSGGPPLGGHG